MIDRIEWERDAVVWLAGRRLEDRAEPGESPGDPAQARAADAFRAWRAAAAEEAGAERFAERVRARVAGRGRGVRQVERAPTTVPAAPPGEVAATLAAAREAHAAPLLELGVAAGTGRELLEEPCEAWVALPAELPAGRYVALRVVGDSMVPLLRSGDVVLVDLDGTAAAGLVAVFRHPEHGYVVKRVGRTGLGGLRLESLNPAYPALVLAPGTGALIGPVVLRWRGPGQSKPRLAPAP
jgi:SOS-response transcriptional repressor LexA